VGKNRRGRNRTQEKGFSFPSVADPETLERSRGKTKRGRRGGEPHERPYSAEIPEGDRSTGVRGS